MISPSTRALILESLAAGVPLDAAAFAAGVRPRADAARLTREDAAAHGWAGELAASTEAGMAPPVEPVDASTPTSWGGDVARASAEPVVGPREAVGDAEASGDRLAQITAEASRLAPGPFGFFLWTDARCIAAGMPPASPWWRWAIGSFYASRKPLGVFLVGRGGGKSTTLEKAAADRSLFAPRKVPPGQTWTWPFISVGPDDANRRISGIAAVYRAIGLTVIGEENAEGSRHKDGVKISRAPRGSLELVDLRGNTIQLASVAGTIGNVSGPSTIGGTVDEAAKLLDKSTNANPLTEIVASLAQTSRAREGWQAIISSSAWTKAGAHYQLVEQGENESNFVATIGEPFIADALAGFESVAQWEESGGQGRAPDRVAAEIVREHMRGLSARSPMVPTWTANPTLGHPEALPWNGAALASRKLVQGLPASALGGVPRVVFWLRENGSVPIEAGARANAAAPWSAEDWQAHAAALRGMGPQRVSETDFGPLHFDDMGQRTGGTPGRWRGL